MRRAHLQFRSQAVSPPGGLESTGDAVHPTSARKPCAGAAVLESPSRHPFTKKGAGAFTLQRPISSVHAGSYEPHSFSAVGVGRHGQVFSVFTSNPERVQFAASRQDNTPDRFRKGGVGGFHGEFLVQLRQTLRLEAL